MMDILITGGAGFIGSNLADHYLSQGAEVTVVDNLSRRGVTANLAWLQNRYPDRLRFEQVDVRSSEQISSLVRDLKPKRIYHLAAQVAVTSSVLDPRMDFETNALGALNVLEAVRQHSPESVVVFTSTNKVYGALDDIPVIEESERYTFQDRVGVSETTPLEFHSPYGCSKGAADQYVCDYARIYGLNTVVFRMSCIYGRRQFGNEDQGWIAHFLISWRQGRRITIFGDGKQVRDVLWVEDLVDALDKAATEIEVTSGQVYNIGGGPDSAISIWHDFSNIAARHVGTQPDVQFETWRPGDQRIYVSDISKAQQQLDWSPRVGPEQGIQMLAEWIMESDDLFGTGVEQTDVPLAR